MLAPLRVVIPPSPAEAQPSVTSSAPFGDRVLGTGVDGVGLWISASPAVFGTQNGTESKRRGARSAGKLPKYARGRRGRDRHGVVEDFKVNGCEEEEKVFS